MSMIKLIHSSNLPDGLSTEFGRFTVMEDPAKFTKRAAACDLFDYESLKPDKDHVGIHLVALGDVETYGFNRNGDGFPKSACKKYHGTFVKDGAVYRNHKHTDRKESIGEIKASAYNEPMGRIELFIHADKKKAEPELQKLASDGETPHSMSCRVPGDRCSRCNTFRKSAKDPNQCDHVKYALAQLNDDGSVNGVYNDDPTYFDISFVIKPADRIAWSLKTASVTDFTKISSVALAEMEGVFAPPEIMLPSRSAMTKFELAKKLAGYEKLYCRMAEAGPSSSSEAEMWELRKSASCRSVSDQIISALRGFEPGDALYALAANGIVMDPVSYVKYAMGVDMGTLAAHMDDIKSACAGLVSRLLDTGEIYDVCNESIYDVEDFTKYGGYSRNAAVKTAQAAYHSGSLDPAVVRERTILATIDRLHIGCPFIKNSSENRNSGLAECVAKKYIAYKLAAAGAMQAMSRDSIEQHLALMAVGNMINVKE